MKVHRNLGAIAMLLFLSALAVAQTPKTEVTTFQLGNQLTVIPAPEGFEEAAGQFEAVKNQFSLPEIPENDMLAVLFRARKPTNYERVALWASVFIRRFLSGRPPATSIIQPNALRTLSPLSEKLVRKYSTLIVPP